MDITVTQTVKRERQVINRGHMIFALSLMAQFQLWDGLITQTFVKRGLAVEGNMLMSGLVQSGSFLIFKIIGVVAVSALLWLLYKMYPRLAIGASIAIAVFYAGVVTWNLLVVFDKVLPISFA